MTKIFISYRRSDSPGFAGRLAAALEKQFGRENVFRDIHALQPGVDFTQAIEEAVSACDVLIPVIGRQWETTLMEKESPGGGQDYLLTEIGHSLKLGKRVIPVLVDGAKPPLEETLPDEIKDLARRHALELSDERWDYDVKRLTSAIEARDRRMSSRTIWAVVGLALAIGLGLLGLKLWRGAEELVPEEPGVYLRHDVSRVNALTLDDLLEVPGSDVSAEEFDTWCLKKDTDRYTKLSLDDIEFCDVVNPED